MTVDADEILVVLQGHEAAEIGAEGAGLVVVAGGADEEGRVVDDLAEVLHDLVVHLDPHPDLDAPLGQADTVAAGDGAHPLGADPAGREDDAFRRVGVPVGDHPGHPAVVDEQVAHVLGMVEEHAPRLDFPGHGLDVTGQVVTAQVLLADEQQVDAVLARLLADGPGRVHVGGEDLAVHAVAVEDGLGLVDQLAGLGKAEELGEVGLAEFVNEVELAVGKEPGPADAAEDVAGAAVDAAPVADGAVPLERRLALVDEQHPQGRVLAQPVGGEQAGRPAADNDHVKGAYGC